MPNLFHKYQQPIWIVLTLVIIATFVLFWNGSMISHGVLGGSSAKVASIYGHTITDADFVRDAHKFQIAAGLEMRGLIGPLAGDAKTQDEAMQNFVFNSYVFDHEAQALGVYPTDAEVQEAESQIPGFQTDGKFDAQKLASFIQNALPSLGFTDSVIDELARKQVQVEKVAQLIGATVDLSPAQLHNRYATENSTMHLDVIRMNASDVAKSIQISDADVQKAYDAKKDTYKSPEQRKVSIATFELSPTDLNLKGKDRTDALQKLGDKSYAFAQSVADKGADFPALAAKAGAVVTESGLFTENEPDPNLTKIATLASVTFSLTPDAPNSQVVEGQNGYYVLHLDGVVASQQLTIAQSKAQIISGLQSDRAAQLMQTKATEAKATILAALKAGKSIQDAAKAAGLETEEIPPFTLADASKIDVPDLQSIIQNSVTLSDGQLSDFATSEAGGLFVYLAARDSVSKGTATMGELLVKDQYAAQMKEGAFGEWLRLRKEAARLQILQNGS